MGILEGKKILVTGVLTEASIAYATARIAQEQGATVVLSNFGRALSLCQRIAKRLPQEAPVIELDVTNTEHLSTLADRLRASWVRRDLDGVVHSIGFAPQEAMGEGFPEVPWEPVATAFQVSAWSLRLAHPRLPAAVRGDVLGRRPHLRRHRRLAGLRLDGPAKAASRRRPGTSPANWAPRACGSTSSPPARCAAWP